jgi:N-acetylglutamate synthase-like GNAT family acetyltransferase
VIIRRIRPDDVEPLRAFLGAADLTVAGVDEPTVRLWVERDDAGLVVGSAGYELSADGDHALIRSVAVAPAARSSGAGSRLASFALADADRSGAKRAWLFSRRSGPFWQKLGFETAACDDLAAALPSTHQVRLFTRTGQLAREIAWSKRLDGSTKSEVASMNG